jgi:S-adenosylmethionine-diacylglycerol 3-amino-3-carboxypropyl transferase
MPNTATTLNLSDIQPVPARVEKRLPNLISRKLKPIHQSIFKNIHNNNLIYNTCWEDPRCDRALLELNRESRVVMITSAGCNALDYALDRPTEIHCIDMNPRQNALLDLKISAIQHTDAQNLFQLFGQGGYDDAENLYHTILRPTLPNYARRYWDKNIGFFVPKGIRKSFYWHSTSGLVAWFFTTYLKAQGKTYRIAEQLFAAKNLAEQSELYGQLEKEMMTNFVKWLMSQHLFMCFLGVPQSQQQLLSVAQNDSKTKNTDLSRDHREGVLVAFIQRSLRQVFTKLPISDNYFWQLYFNGKYTPDCCPNYLKPENHAVLRKETTKIRTYTTTITSFLEQNPASYSHYVLLDHQDWLAANDRAALAEEWQAILKNSHSGTRILLRSAANTVDFFPDFIHKHIVFEKEKTAEMHKIDRVGTYGSVYLGIVK